jgi:hypothetical protein
VAIGAQLAADLLPLADIKPPVAVCYLYLGVVLGIICLQTDDFGFFRF